MIREHIQWANGSLCPPTNPLPTVVLDAEAHRLDQGWKPRPVHANIITSEDPGFLSLSSPHRADYALHKIKITAREKTKYLANTLGNQNKKNPVFSSRASFGETLINRQISDIV